MKANDGRIRKALLDLPDDLEGAAGGQAQAATAGGVGLAGLEPAGVDRHFQRIGHPYSLCEDCHIVHKTMPCGIAHPGAFSEGAAEVRRAGPVSFWPSSIA